jgi:nucleotide-binding universal stress UspA family protein
MSRAILVPFDGSAVAGRVVPYAQELAKACDADLLLVHACAGEAEEARRGALQRLAALRDRCAAMHLRVQTVVEEAAPAAAITAVAGRDDAALVVMGTVGASGPSRWVLGSVAEQVVRHSRIPVLLMTPRALDASTPTCFYRGIVVPVDGSELSRQVYPVARTLAGHLRAPITFFQALEDALFSVFPNHMSAAERADLRAQIAQRILAGLQRRALEWAATGLKAEAAVVSGPAMSALLDVVADRGAGCLAMVSHGRGGYGGQALGSTALAVLRRATVPVLLGGVPKQDPYHLGGSVGRGPRVAS